MMSNYIILSLFSFIIIYGFVKKVNIYDSFIEGAKGTVKTIISMFPTLIAFYISLSFLLSSGLIDFIEDNMNFEYGVVLVQSLVRPLSSSASMSIMLECISKYGSDHLITIISTMIHYVSDASIYIITFYFGMYKIKNMDYLLKYGLMINLFSYLVSIILVIIFL